MKPRTYIPYAFLISMLFACTSKELKVKDYLQWIEQEKNGLLVKQQIDHIEYGCQYKPKTYLVLKRNPKLPVKDFEQALEEYEDLHYFSLLIKEQAKATSLNQQQKADKVKYYSFQIQQDLRLVEGRDTLACVFAHYDPSYGIRDYEKILLAFEKREVVSNDDLELLLYNRIEDHHAKMMIQRENIIQIPSIKF
ncbi:MAG: hypothetical protein AAF806_18940 [Bacteroidota bacterium]